MLRDLAVGKDHAPHDFSEHHLLPGVVTLLELRCEAKVVHCLATLFVGQRHERASGFRRESEVPLEYSLEVRLLGIGELAVGMSDVQQQYARRQVQRVNRRRRRRRAIACRNVAVQQSLDGIDQHLTSRVVRCWSAKFIRPDVKRVRPFLQNQPPSALEHKVRVAHILGDLTLAGLHPRVLSLVRELPDYSHAIVFNSGNRGPLYDAFSATCEMVQCPSARGSVLGGLRYVPRLAASLRKLAPDVVIAHLFGNHALVSLAARVAGVPVTFGVSANDPVHFAKSRWQPLLLAQFARPFCRGEIAVSESVGAVLRDALLLPAHRVHVVTNGCAVEAIAARASASRSRVRDGTSARRLLMVAWVAREKDHETAIRAVVNLRQRGHDIRLDLAGGAYRQARQVALQDLAHTLGVSDVVTFLGVREDVPELLGASDVLIHSTHSEGFGLSVIEAFASRTPVVATDIPACREVLDHGRCGILVPPRDPDAMADAIETLLTNQGVREELIEAAYQRVQERYHSRRMAAGYAVLIDAATTTARDPS